MCAQGELFRPGAAQRIGALLAPAPQAVRVHHAGLQSAASAHRTRGDGRLRTAQTRSAALTQTEAQNRK